MKEKRRGRSRRHSKSGLVKSELEIRQKQEERGNLRSLEVGGEEDSGGGPSRIRLLWFGLGVACSSL